jgi:hypothetical protein
MIANDPDFLKEVRSEDLTPKEKVDETVNQSKKAMNSLERIKERLAQDEKDESEYRAPSYEEVLFDDKHWEDIVYIYKIMEKYRDGDFDKFIAEIDADLIMLSAGIVRLSTLVGYMKGSFYHAESSRRVLRSKYHVRTKQIAEDLNIMITEALAESISRVEASEFYRYTSELSISQEMLQSLYYSAMAFVRVLEGSAQRLQHERMGRMNQ